MWQCVTAATGTNAPPLSEASLGLHPLRCVADGACPFVIQLRAGQAPRLPLTGHSSVLHGAWRSARGQSVAVDFIE